MYQLFLKREKRPYNINQEQYEIISPVWEEFVLNRKDAIVKLFDKDIRVSDIEKINRDEAVDDEEVLSNKDLIKFEEDVLKEYLEDGKLTILGEYKLYSDNKMYRVELHSDEVLKVHYGNTNKEISFVEWKRDVAIKDHSSFRIMIVKANVKYFHQLRARVEAWKDYKSRVAFAKKKELENLEKTHEEEEL